MRTLVTFGLGALTMYLLDPEHGAQRRAQFRDRLTRAQRKALSRQLERDRPSATPEGVQHLGR